MTTTNEQLQVNSDNVVKAGLKAMIAENMGFDPKRIVLLESSEEDNITTWVAFEVAGQGYTWNLADHTFMVMNAYGDRLYGDAQDF